MEKKGIIDKVTSCKLDATAVAGLAAFICGVDICWPIAPIAMRIDGRGFDTSGLRGRWFSPDYHEPNAFEITTAAILHYPDDGASTCPIEALLSLCRAR